MEIEKRTLYIVGTPIGNLGDLSPRAVEVLEKVDFIAAEDTRVTLKLLNHFGIKKPMISYFEHNKAERGGWITSRIQGGESCALVSDAGMPAISDPGETLVAECAEAGIPVYAVPGPSAVIAALAVSGLPTGRFTFEGFLSMNKKNRHEHLLSLQNENRTMVFYEAPHKLRRTLSDLYKVFGERKIAMVREITKIHEEALRMNLSEAAKLYKDKEPRGEFVLVIEGAALPEREKEITLEEAVEMAENLMKQGQSASDAAKAAVLDTTIKKGDVYRCLSRNN
ncbi:16S rRNA (cytidine(1402)-2'-O)-methyltransferase [Scatolibacter rhodanostii]|uniref:16S rRNA (cytidine(1402)-2'-O)-methyltransferase n=1 Tax=Scatolibacter rhodanostii TaxID=2014781 RepID=UPI000C08B367|nr:16S rRNA (cytidine(1402)-2'-O)-methyltransferase [Scatolibacter rhodanostii]